MKMLNMTTQPEMKTNLPEKIIQFGEGNFLRCFIDWMIKRLNDKNLFNGRVVAVQPTPHGQVVGKLNEQDALYTTILRGIQNGTTINKAEIINSVSRGINPYTNWHDVLKCAENPAIEYVFSNTTEAGLTYNNEDTAQMQPPLSFPAKLTLYLYHRYEYFHGAANKGMYIIPCELLEANGDLLKKIILHYCADWNLPQNFINWLNNNNKFYNTLVDRVVSGYPKDEIEELTVKLQYEDKLLVCGEPFHFFAIEGDEILKEKLPFAKIGLNVVVEKDISKYRQRKVRLLNGGHTANVPASFLSGLDTVAQMMEDDTTGRFSCHVINDIILPSIDMDKEMLSEFAYSVVERFQNPFIKHYLLSILLNSTSKFKVRVLPSLLQYHDKFNKFPDELLFSFAAYIYIYKPIRTADNHLYGLRNGQEYELTDDKININKLEQAWKLYANSESTARQTAVAIVNDASLWDTDFSVFPEVAETVGSYLYQIDTKGCKAAMKNLLSVGVSL